MGSGKDSARRVYALAARLGVGIGEACDSAGIARSTPPRWKTGTKPRPQQLALLRHAIMELAKLKGTISAVDTGGGIDEPIDRNAIVAALAAAKDTVTRLEAVLGILDPAA